MDYLSSMPLELIFNIIIPNMSHYDILNLSLSSQNLNSKLCSNPFFWKSFYYQTISSVPLSDESSGLLSNINDYQNKYKQIIFDLKCKNLNQKLIYAATNGYNLLVQELVNTGDIITSENNEALIWSAANGHLDIIKYFWLP